jgi:hypothetical protein
MSRLRRRPRPRRPGQRTRTRSRRTKTSASATMTPSPSMPSDRRCRPGCAGRMGRYAAGSRDNGNVLFVALVLPTPMGYMLDDLCLILVWLTRHATALDGYGAGSPHMLTPLSRSLCTYCRKDIPFTALPPVTVKKPSKPKPKPSDSKAGDKDSGPAEKVMYANGPLA